jgi:hypothetical protein
MVGAPAFPVFDNGKGIVRFAEIKAFSIRLPLIVSMIYQFRVLARTVELFQGKDICDPNSQPQDHELSQAIVREQSAPSSH